MIVLGIDPGSQFTGYGVIEVEDGGERVIEFGVLRLDETADHHLRLKDIYDRVTACIDRCMPDECAIEMPVYGRNPQSILKLGRAQAAAILAALNRQIPVAQYTPKEVKKSVTGNGSASKQQVWYMVRALLSIAESEEMALDASDALAVGLCHAHRGEIGTRSKSESWEAFVRENPERIL